jgi:hypothetical protein
VVHSFLAFEELQFCPIIAHHVDFRKENEKVVAISLF